MKKIRKKDNHEIAKRQKQDDINEKGGFLEFSR